VEGLGVDPDPGVGGAATEQVDEPPLANALDGDLTGLRQADGLYVGTMEMLAQEPRESLTENFSGLTDLLRGLLEEAGAPYDSLKTDFDDASWVGYRLAELLPLPVSLKQSLLELDDARRRLERLEPHIAELTASENV